MWRSNVWIKENEEEVATVSMVMMAAMGDGKSSKGMKRVAERGSIIGSAIKRTWLLLQ